MGALAHQQQMLHQQFVSIPGGINDAFLNELLNVSDF